MSSGGPAQPGQSALPPAGWYAAGQGPGLRWWDGQQWTEHQQPAPPPPGPPASAPGATRLPLNRGKVSGAAQRALEDLNYDSPPWLVLAPGGAAGLLAAWEDRLAIVKTGAITSFMAGALGGGRTATFHFVDITGLEYNSGLLNGVLEVLTASYEGTSNRDFWRGSHRSRNADANDPWVLSNTLPLAKHEYRTAQPEISELRRRIGEAKRRR